RKSSSKNRRSASDAKKILHAALDPRRRRKLVLNRYASSVRKSEVSRCLSLQLLADARRDLFESERERLRPIELSNFAQRREGREGFLDGPAKKGDIDRRKLGVELS